MANPHGSYVWYELLTTDTEAAGRFYADVIGWSVDSYDSTVAGYHVLAIGTEGIGGMMTLPPGGAESGMRPGWLGYIGVDDVDAAIAAITAAGGALHMPAMDIPNVGRIALAADPQGLPFYVMKVAGAGEGSSGAFDPARAGHCSWNELVASDLPAALAFYTGQFGWTKGDVMPMGELGDYQFIDHAGGTIGAMMAAPPGGPPPGWNYYFRVEDIDTAAGRIGDGGGTILNGPMEVPGDDHILQAVDPQGVPFAIVGKRAAAKADA